MKIQAYHVGAAQGVVVSLLSGCVLGAWQQVLDTLAGRTVYALLGFWAAVALGVAVGAAVVWNVNRKGLWHMGYTVMVLSLLGIWLVVQLAMSAALRDVWKEVQLSAHKSFGMYLWTIAKTAGLTLAPPAALAACLVQGGQNGGRRGERATGWCLVLCGYLAAGFLCAHLAPERLTQGVAIGMGVLAGVSVLRSSRYLPAVWLPAMALPVVVIALLAVALLPKTRLDPLSADGRFGRLAYRDSGFGKGVPDTVFAVRGHAVVRYADADYGFVGALDGRSLIFGNRFATARALTGYAPLMVRPSAKTALLIGAESGVYLPFFQRAEIDVTAETPMRLVQPFVAMDAEIAGGSPTAALGQGHRSYDIIFVAPEPGWVRGSHHALSRKQLARYRQALSEDGVVALKVDGRALSEARFAAIARDFTAVFPGVQVWCTGAADWVLLGCAKEIKVPMDNLIALLGKDLVFRDWVRAGNMGLPEILACMVCDAKGLAAWLEGRAAEDASAAMWQAPKRVISDTNVLATALEPVRQPKAEWVLPGEMDVDLYVDLMARVVEVREARGLAVRALAEGREGLHAESMATAVAAAAITARDALLLQMADLMAITARRRIAIGDYKGGLRCFESLIAFSTPTAYYYHGMGFCQRATGDNESAYRHFKLAVEAAPEQTAYRFDLAMAALTMGAFAEADSQYQDILKREPENAMAHFLFAKALIKHDRPDRDIEQAVKLAEHACELSKWKDPDIAYGLADIYLETGRVLEGLGLKRKLQEQLR